MVQVLVLVTGALLCLQLANALPHMKREAVAIRSSAEKNNIQLQLRNYTTHEFVQCLKWILDHGSVVVSNAVRDLNEIPVKGELLQANITRMSHIATGSSHINLESNEGVVKLIENVVNFAVMMTDYEHMPADSELRNTLKTALENNGYNQFGKQAVQKYIERVDNFENAFNKLIELYDDYKTESDKKKKWKKLIEVLSFLP